MGTLRHQRPNPSLNADPPTAVAFGTLSVFIGSLVAHGRAG